MRRATSSLLLRVAERRMEYTRLYYIELQEACREHRLLRVYEKVVGRQAKRWYPHL
jgi:hypothetical protein